MADDAATKPRSILVTGDVVADHYVYEGREKRHGSVIRLGAIGRRSLGGAALLHKLLQSVLPQKDRVAFGFKPTEILKVAACGYCIMRPFKKSHDADKPKDKSHVWRMDEGLGFGDQPTDDWTIITDDCNAKQEIAPEAVDADALGKRYGVVVIDDAGLFFRRWPSKIAWPKFLAEQSQPLPDWLVLKVSGPVASADLWHTVVSGETQELAPRKLNEPNGLPARTVAVVSINDLRVETLQISKCLSWEQTALDLVTELTKNPQLAGLRALRFVVVNFGTEGALLAEFKADGPRFQLVFDPKRLEGDFEASVEGNVIGFQACLTTAIVARLADEKTTEANAAKAIEDGMIAGLGAMRRLLVEGHGKVADPPNRSDPKFPVAEIVKEIEAAEREWQYGSVEIDAKIDRPGEWTIINRSGNRGNASPLYGLARRVALRGVKQLWETPYQQFGKLFSVERSEIESLRALQGLMLRYRDDLEAKKPLSIAAFGPPGAGKSFGVKELAKAVFGEHSPPLEFNLSQFKDSSDLHGLFHQVRDEVLKGATPVVFWDEFDSQDLKWLQYFLSPMQDGSFQDGQVTHPIGKCIFVFAGGTRKKFERFGKRTNDERDDLNASSNDDEGALERKWKEFFASRKGPDFISRLAGYINVLGPNPSDEGDFTFPVRRALLLRVHFGVGLQDRAVIDPGLLAAFLEIDEYRHGSRSMEKIAEQVKLRRRTDEFTRSDLPPRSQLAMHVDADRFISLVERDR